MTVCLCDVFHLANDIKGKFFVMYLIYLRSFVMKLFVNYWSKFVFRIVTRHRKIYFQKHFTSRTDFCTHGVLDHLWISKYLGTTAFGGSDFLHSHLTALKGMISFDDKTMMMIKRKFLGQIVHKCIPNNYWFIPPPRVELFLFHKYPSKYSSKRWFFFL